MGPRTEEPGILGCTLLGLDTQRANHGSQIFFLSPNPQQIANHKLDSGISRWLMWPLQGSEGLGIHLWKGCWDCGTLKKHGHGAGQARVGRGQGNRRKGW